MIIETRWLKEYLPELSWDIHTLANKITSLGHEAEVVDDTHLEVEITPNRGDCYSIFGLARDIAGVYQINLKQPELAETPQPGEVLSLAVGDEVKSAVSYDLLVDIADYQAMDSPEEIISRLAELGLSPKDLIVDLTNIVAYEIGSPLHVFNYAKVKSGLEVTLSTEGEEIALLDGKIVNLPSGCLIQKTNGKIIDLAGVMGGFDSAVDKSTDHFVLQAAAFDPSLIRTTSRKSNVQTSASLQYQKGVAAFTAEMGVRRFLYLLKKYQSGVSINHQQVYGKIANSTETPINLAKINQLIGHEFEQKDMARLENLGFKITDNGISAPSWRQDVNSTAELAEELARVVGLDKILPKELSKKTVEKDNDFRRLQTLKEKLVVLGLTEHLGYSFTNNGSVEIANPFNRHESYLRSTLKESLLSAVSRNPYMKKVCYFEVGHVFNNDEAPKLGFISPSLDDSLIAKIEEVTGTNLIFEPVTAEELAKRDIKFGRVVFAETDLAPVLEKITPGQSFNTDLSAYKPISKYPSIVRDISILVDKSIDPAKIIDNLSSHPQVFIVEQSDSYESEKLGPDKISRTFRIFMQNLEKSLTDNEADGYLKECLNNLSKEVQFTLR
jgi:phenylalanyl-tRNA synthetase beta chain